MIVIIGSTRASENMCLKQVDHRNPGATITLPIMNMQPTVHNITRSHINRDSRRIVFTVDSCLMSSFLCSFHQHNSKAGGQ